MVGGEGLEPSRPFGQQILSLSWLPVTTPARIENGGAYGIRTRVKGFADPYLTPRPTRRKCGNF